ncbi:MAG: ribonuclease Y [Vigna little leaf phytoplasma]|nr:ribonuclease Y [Vigna little leaf phytoplasma]
MSETIISINFILFILLFFSNMVVFLYYVYQKNKIQNMIKNTESKNKEKIIQSQIIASKIISEAERKIYLLKQETEDDLNQRRKVIINLEEKIIHKEELLVYRTKYLNEKEEFLDTKEQKINQQKTKLDQLQHQIKNILDQQQVKLEEISHLTKKQAKNMIISEIKKNISQEIINYEKEKLEECKFQIKKKAKNLMVLAMQKLSREVVSSHNISMVFLENDELKGRIIGKEGRNIKTFEIITGVDLIIDDVPNNVFLSSFDPIRREIAKRTLENLILDGRITPVSIEKTFQDISNEVDKFIQEIGEEAVYESKIGVIDEYLIQLLGKLYFRTSYGQNVLHHSLEVSFLAGKLAVELGENEILARRAGLLHDIGKALDCHMEGSHVKIGIELCIKYQESREIIDAIASHHEEQEPQTLIAILVIIADQISSARPGARKDSIENYIQRIMQLEQIANKIKGVEKAYAIRSGRELRVIVKAEEVDDNTTFLIAKQIKNQIQRQINYNGSIKITVLRETRAIEIADVNNNYAS